MKKDVLGKRGIAMLLLFFTAYGSVYAQCKEIKWPENKSKAEECFVTWGEAIKSKNYARGASSIAWMLKNAPQWNVKLYVDGATIYEALATAAQDPAKKKIYADSLMIIYDMRIANCGDEVNVLNRKAFSALKLNSSDKTKIKELFDMYERLFTIAQGNVLDVNLLGYMNAIYLNFIHLKSLTEDGVIERYDKITQIYDKKLAGATAANDAKSIENLKKYKQDIDQKLSLMVKLDCNFVKQKLEPRFRKTPDDIELVYRMFRVMTKDGCIDDPLWLQVAEKVHETKPDFSLASNMAKVYAKQGKMAKAVENAAQAEKLAADSKEKAEAIILQGDIASTEGDKIKAREHYRRALGADANNKEAYTKIGDLYMNAFNDCAKKKNMAEDRLVYIAAYNMYNRAGDARKMTQAKAQFPSVAELFELNWKEGETKQISCWINEAVTLKTRGKE